MGKRGKVRHKGNAKAREPNGRYSRKPADMAARLQGALDREELNTLSVATEARQRVFGVLPEDSRDQRAGSFVGRLRMRGELSQPQYEAAIKWQADCEDYSWAVGSPRRPNAVDLNWVRGKPTSQENVAAVKRIMAKHKAATKAVQAAQLELRGRGNLFGALEAVVIRDIELLHLTPDLRCALNALAKHYRFEERVAA